MILATLWQGKDANSVETPGAKLPQHHPEKHKAPLTRSRHLPVFLSYHLLFLQTGRPPRARVVLRAAVACTLWFDSEPKMLRLSPYLLFFASLPAITTTCPRALASVSRPAVSEPAIAASAGKSAIIREEEAPRRIYNAEAVTVTTARELKNSAVTRTAIDSASMARERGRSLADLLGDGSPLFVRTSSSGAPATVSFRGAAASHTRIEWNGIGIDNPMNGETDFSRIPLWFADRVELLYGGSSLQNGAGALGGSILLGTTPRWDRALYGEVSQDIGSFSTYRTFASVGSSGKKFHARGRYFYESSRNDFEYLNTAIPPFAVERQKQAFYWNQGVAADLNFRAPREHYLTLNLWWQEGLRSFPPVISYEGNGRNESRRDRTLNAVLKWQKFGTAGLAAKPYKSELLVGLSVPQMDYRQQTNVGSGMRDIIDSHSKAQSFYNKYSFEIDLSAKTVLRLLANANFYDVSSLDRVRSEGYSARRTELGLTAAVYHRFGQRLNTYLLLRGEYADDTFTPLIPSAGAEYGLIDRGAHYLGLHLNATRNYHRPTLNDLYWRPGGNPNLLPEEGVTGDFGLAYSGQANALSFNVSVNGYMSRIDHWILWLPVGQSAFWSAQNLRQVFARGIEALAKAKWQAPHSLWHANLTANYAYTRTTNQEALSPGDQSAGKQLPYIPIHKATATAEIAYGNYYFNYRWNYVSERFTTTSNVSQYRLPAYSLFGLAIGGSVPLTRPARRSDGLRAEAELRIDTLFDTDYQAVLWRPMPGRNYTARLRLVF